MSKRLSVPLLILVFCISLPVAIAIAARARDRDHDKLPDKWEKRYHISTKKKSGKRDPDHDRLNNRREYKAHTNPRRKDTDRDGLSDYAEVVRWKTNPRRKDTDRDGFSDRAEIRAGTNPRSAADHPAVPGSVPSGGTSSPARPAACTSSTANVAGGKDPWGGCWPGASTTGVPAGTVLTSYTGPCTITANNTVIDSKTVNCGLTIRASGVQITKSKINGSVSIDDQDGSYSFAISDSEVDAGESNASTDDGATAIGKGHFVATRVHTHGGIRGVWCEYDCTLRDSWIHGQARDSGGQAHESGVRMGDGSNLVHNSLLCDAPNVPPDAGCSADLTGYGDFAPIRNNNIEKNLFLASTGGACAYGGSSGDDGSKPYGKQAANIVFKDNVFQRRSSIQASGKCGEYFPITDFDKSRPGNQWTNNRWDNGSTLASAN